MLPNCSHLLTDFRTVFVFALGPFLSMKVIFFDLNGNFNGSENSQEVKIFKLSKKGVVCVMFVNGAVYLYKFFCYTQNSWHWRNSHRPMSFDGDTAASSPDVLLHCLVLLDTRIQPPRGCSLSTSKRPPPLCRCLLNKHRRDLSYSSTPQPNIGWWHLRWQRPGVHLHFGRSLRHQSSSSCRCSKSSSGRHSAPSHVHRNQRTCLCCILLVLKEFRD